MPLFTTRMMIKRILGLRTPTHLGRWEHRQTEKQLEFKQTWANADHCGDIICGTPQRIIDNMAQKNCTKTTK